MACHPAMYGFVRAFVLHFSYLDAFAFRGPIEVGGTNRRLHHAGGERNGTYVSLLQHCGSSCARAGGRRRRDSAVGGAVQAGDKPQRYMSVFRLSAVVGVAGRRRGSFIFVPIVHAGWYRHTKV